MSRAARVLAVAACGLVPAGCANWMPSIDFSGALTPASAAATIEVQSEPPGAEAKSPAGAGCRTPCTLPAPASGEFTVSFALEGYQTQTVMVRPLPAEFREFGTPNAARFDPSPVFAQLEPAPPPPRGRQKRPKPARTSAASRPAPAPAPAAQ
jgi:hypothetical protein